MPIGPLIASGIGAGATVLGHALQGRAANKGANRQWELLAQEMERRNAIQGGVLAPSTLHALGYRNPPDIERMTTVLRGQPGAYGPPAGTVPRTTSSPMSSVLGKVGTGLGVAGAAGSAGLLGSLAPATKVGLGMTGVASGAGGVPGAMGLGGGAGLLGLGAATIPVLGGMIAGGAYAANKIGQGRRTANTMTEGGPQEQFGQAIATARTPQELAAAKQQFMAAIQQWQSAGGNQRKVAEQAVNTPELWDTYNRRLAELGGR